MDATTAAFLAALSALLAASAALSAASLTAAVASTALPVAWRAVATHICAWPSTAASATLCDSCNRAISARWLVRSVCTAP
ncbi:hypothetical protein D3C87_1608630 [compost metagenome]